jgi:hypothetical protein
VLISTYKRAGEPVIVAFGAVRDGTALRCGLLFVRGGLKQLEFTLFNEAERLKVRLPETYIKSADEYYRNATLEAYEQDSV